MLPLHVGRKINNIDSRLNVKKQTISHDDSYKTLDY
jgi:hypothetical protein